MFVRDCGWLTDSPSVSDSVSEKRDEQLQCGQLYCIRAGTGAGGGGGTIQPSLHRTKTRVKLTAPDILTLKCTALLK